MTDVDPDDDPVTDVAVTDDPVTDDPVTDVAVTDDPETDVAVTDDPVTDVAGAVVSRSRPAATQAGNPPSRTAPVSCPK